MILQPLDVDTDLWIPLAQTNLSDYVWDGGVLKTKYTTNSLSDIPNSSDSICFEDNKNMFAATSKRSLDKKAWSNSIMKSGLHYTSLEVIAIR